MTNGPYLIKQADGTIVLVHNLATARYYINNEGALEIIDPLFNRVIYSK